MRVTCAVTALSVWVFCSAIATVLAGFALTKQTGRTTCPQRSSNLYDAKKRHSGSAGTGVGWIDPSAPVNSKAAMQKTVQKSLEGADFKKRLSLLGCTGSIGTQTLEIVDACPENFVVDALSAGTNVELMTKQVLQYKPKIASMSTEAAAQELTERLRAAKCTDMPEIMWGDDGILAAATVASADTVVTGIVGAAGLKPTIEAIKLKKDIALANKETLISGGPVINPLVEEYGVNMVGL
jgi:1-deoxy-D-xylulose-5-phosphate reductoisomerase